MKLCDYGCGKEAKYQFKNGKWCCEKNVNKCSEVRKKFKGKNHSEIVRKKMSESHKGHSCSEETRIKISNALRGCVKSKETRRKLSESHIGYKCSEKTIEKMRESSKKENLSKETRRKLSESHKGHKGLRLTIKQIKKRYPFFSRIEEMRYNPDKLGEKEIQVHCKNHNCPNSKEQGGWFTPTYIQLYERIRQLENDWGNCSSYFYCSKECKNICPLYGKTVNQLIKEVEIQQGTYEIEELYSSEEYQTFREIVLKRDDYKCIYCGEKAEHVHHTRPQKLEPFFSLDPDYAISVCKECHYKYGHKTGTECSTGNLANRIC